MTVASRAVGAAARPSALVVDPLGEVSDVYVSTLIAAGFDVALERTFEAAKLHLAEAIPDVLIAAIRLGEYNGLHLVLRAKAIRPSLAALVLSPSDDSVLAADADETGATFVVQPVTASEFAAAVSRTICRSRETATVESIRPPFERRVEERRRFALPAPSGEERRCLADRRTVVAAPADHLV